MSNIIILYSTTDGHTIHICNKMTELLQENAHIVTLQAIASVTKDQLIAADKIVLGAAIRYGKHKPEVLEFIRQYQDVLDAKPNAFFTVSVVARKPNRNTPETNIYLKKFLKKISWRPKLLGVFAGKLDYQKYGFFDRTMIRFIMYLTKGPTDPNTVVEFTDWTEVDNFTQKISEL